MNKNQVKLSPTMQKVMDKVMAADWYYMHDGKTCEHFAMNGKYRPVGFEGVGVVEGGFVYARMDSKTLEALSKRGLVEIVRDGKQSLDVMKVTGFVAPPRLENALMVRITTRQTDRPHWKPHSFIGYAATEADIPVLLDRYNKGTTEAEIEAIGEVALDVWNINKKKYGGDEE